ncbi:MAG: hypothetical protein C4526_10320 [Nitrospiraceae bacterium]|nr:MAG: hypothetical protein C4526_10320 [Nitrospiraceae bacterium]
MKIINFLQFKRFIIVATLLLCHIGCLPLVKSESQSIVLEHPIQQARKIVLDVIVTYNVDIEKAGDSYIEGFISAGGFPGTYWATGSKVSIWLEPIAEDRTKVYVDTAKRGKLFFFGHPDITGDILRSIDDYSKDIEQRRIEKK